MYCLEQCILKLLIKSSNSRLITKYGDEFYLAVVPNNKKDVCTEVNWEEIDGDIKVELPQNMQVPRGNPVTFTMFCDDAFAGDVLT